MPSFLAAQISPASLKEESQQGIPIDHSRRLTLFASDLSGGGAQWRMVILARAFADRGHTVDLVVVRSHGPLAQELPPSVRSIALNPWGAYLPGVRNRRSRWVLASIPALVRYLQHTQPQVLLSTSHLPNVAALLARSLARVQTKAVIRVDNYVSRSTSKILSKPIRLWQARRLYPWADAIIAISNGVADDVASVTDVPRERITTIYNPVVTPELQEKIRSPLDHPWFVQGSPPVLLGVGRLVVRKDFSTLIRAFARVRAVREARLVILGEGKERTSLERVAQELGVSSDVALLGFVANPFPYMARASVLVQSSTWEGFGNVVAEAMACGCPVVSTDCPSGPSEILDSGRYGPLVPVGDEVALAQAVLSVLEKPLGSERLRERAALFSHDVAIDPYLHVLLGMQ